MAKRTEALINPAILVWARRTSHFDLETAARKAKFEPEQLLQWEAGESRPSIPQLRKLASAYKRPLALFYLDEPPRDFKPIEGYRRVDPDFELTVSPELALEMRKAHTRREIAVDAAQELDELPPPFQFALENRRDPEAAGRELRLFLGIVIADQPAWRTRGEAYSRWRSVRIEGHPHISDDACPRAGGSRFLISRSSVPVRCDQRSRRRSRQDLHTLS